VVKQVSIDNREGRHKADWFSEHRLAWIDPIEAKDKTYREAITDEDYAECALWRCISRYDRGKLTPVSRSV
jgi:hypothetical protein